MRPKRCPNCSANEEWIEEEAWGDWMCGNCDTIIRNDKPAPRPASGLIVRAKDTGTLAYEANVADDSGLPGSDETAEELAAKARSGGKYQDRIWSR